MCNEHSRGAFLSGLVAAGGAALIPRSVFAREQQQYRVRELWLRNALTGEDLRAPFTIDGRTVYTPGYYALCRILRDTHVPLSEGDVLIDIRTIEGLFETQQVLLLAGIRSPIDVYSGYRTPQTNAAVEGAHYSYHMRAQAVDFSVPGVELGYVWRVCNSRPITGGLGFYRGSHIHVDCGPKRYWEG
jgi:uncharacterized protein YcbK (DUF882 family)